MGKIRMTVAQNAELAQSYIAHARSSGRCSPRRSSRETWAMLASFGRASLPQRDHIVGWPCRRFGPGHIVSAFGEVTMPHVTVRAGALVGCFGLGLCRPGSG